MKKTEKKTEGELRFSWAGDMVPRPLGPGEAADYPRYRCGTERIEWVSRALDGDGEPMATRTPEPKTHVFPLAPGFVAAGRLYAGLGMLAARQDGVWGRDIYGRQVLCLRERFPCFDSADLLYEKRYFRWFFLYENGKLTRVFHTDETATVTVTEDVRDVENGCWAQMQREGVFS